MNIRVLFDEIDKDLAKLGKVSRFYSDDDNITITTDYNTYKVNRSMLDGIMGDYGYEFYDYGDNGDKVMLTYNKVSDSRKVKDDLDEDMKLWEERSKDEFGKVLKKIEKYCIDLWGLTNDYEVEGLEQSIISKYINTYALDGDRNYVARRIYRTLEKFDMIDNNDDPRFMKLVNEMLKLGGVNNITDSRNVKDSLENTKFEQEYRTLGKKDRYMLLSRMKSDCDYYLGNGGKNAKHLWANDEEEHIKDMISLWNSFSANEKPEWLTYEELNDYSIAMTGKSLDEWGVQVTDSRKINDSDDEYLLQEIARQLLGGYRAGYEPQWEIDITVDGMDVSEFDDYDQVLIYRDIAYVVEDGYDEYMGIQTELSDGSIVYVDFVLNY